MAKRRGMSKRRGSRKFKTIKRRSKYHQGRKRSRANKMRHGRTRRSRRRMSKIKLFGGAPDASDYRNALQTSVKNSPIFIRTRTRNTNLSTLSADSAEGSSQAFMNESIDKIKGVARLIIKHTSLNAPANLPQQQKQSPDIKQADTQLFLNRLLYACDLAQEYNPETPYEYLQQWSNPAFLGGQLTQYIVFCVGCSAAFSNTEEAENFFTKLDGNYSVAQSNHCAGNFPPVLPAGSDGFVRCTHPGCQIGFNKTISKLLTSIGNNNVALTFVQPGSNGQALIDQGQLGAWNQYDAHGLDITYYQKCVDCINELCQEFRKPSLVFNIQVRTPDSGRPAKLWR